MIIDLKKLIDSIKYILFNASNKDCKKLDIGQSSPLKIKFKSKYFYVRNQQFNLCDISTIYYGVSSLTDEKPIYYIKLLSNQDKLKEILYEGFELVDVDNFIKIINDFNLPVLPTITTSSGVYLIKGFSLSLNYECDIHEKYLVSICFNDLDKDFFKNVSVEKLLEKPKKYTSTNSRKEFNIKILSDKITLNRGYGIFPMLNNEIIIDDIFYYINQEEIKTKIIELFEKHNK